MNKKVLICSLVCLIIIILILGLLIGLKIDYYERIPFDINKNNIFVILNDQPQTVFVNINNKVYEINQWSLVNDKTYVLDFSINKDIKDKIYCYVATYRLNYLSYIFKVVFNI